MVPCEVRQDIYAALTLLTLTRRFSNRCESDLNGGEVGLRVVGKETGALFLQQTGAISESVARTLAGLSSRIQHERRGRNHLRGVEAARRHVDRAPSSGRNPKRWAFCYPNAGDRYPNAIGFTAGQLFQDPQPRYGQSTRDGTAWAAEMIGFSPQGGSGVGKPIGERKGWQHHPSASSSRRSGQRTRDSPAPYMVNKITVGTGMSMVRSRQFQERERHYPVEVHPLHPRHNPARYVQAADGHSGEVIADHPRPPSIQRRDDGIGRWIVRLRFRGEGENCDPAMQFRSPGKDQHGAALPELGKLRVVREVAPVDLPDSRCRPDPWPNAGWRPIPAHFSSSVPEAE